MYMHETGTGPTLVLVHGSAADAEAWAIQRRTLANRYRIITYDRRGTPRSPLPAGVTSYGIAEHAADLAMLIESQAAGPALVCGSSFGGVCVLELARRRPELVRGAIICEPPVLPDDSGQGVLTRFQEAFERTYREQGGEVAAEHFMRMVLGKGYDRLTPSMQARSLSLHHQILLDSRAIVEYRVDYPSLRDVQVPVLLIGGERSSPFFRPTVEALAAALPDAELAILAGGSHMMHADAYAEFNRRITQFGERVS